MKKVKKGPQTWMFPLPALLIGAMVDGNPNVMTAAWGSIANAEPPMVCVAIRRNRYTRNGIEVGGGLTVNIPSARQAREVDFCGIESGAKADKIARCGFTVSTCGATGAPMVEDCPVNLECKIDQIVELGTHSLVVAFVLETYVSENCITDDTLDVAKADPLVYLTGPARKYVHAGAPAGDAFSVGLSLRKKD
ncbi:MAG: flavin reductase family protein [Dehalococcoidia bacterium]|nr:flavin reductase family protein [Dehalococcoidia bacterium]